MKNRYEVLLLNGVEIRVERGYGLEAKEGEKGELVVDKVALSEGNATDEGDETDLKEKIVPIKDGYKNPPLPEGWTEVTGTWNTGKVVRDPKGNEWVWIPAGNLIPNGTLDNKNFNSSFGRRNHREYEFSYKKHFDLLTPAFKKQVASVIKYGGFYVSRYAVSQDYVTRTPCSVAGAFPWIEVTVDEAINIASKLVDQEGGISSHLMYGAEYDTMLEWILQSKKRTVEEMVVNSRLWGNYWNSPESEKAPVKTGSNPNWVVANIYDLAGNVFEATQETFGDDDYVIRGGAFHYSGEMAVAARNIISKKRATFYIGFRAALYIE